MCHHTFFRETLGVILLCIVLFCAPHPTTALPLLPETFNLQTLRKNYLASVEDKALTESQLALLKALKEDTPLLFAYQGAFEALMAKHSWSPHKKISHLNKAQKIFVQAIERDPNDVEIRFLRFSVQYHLPRFLGQSSHLDEDLAVMLKHIQAGVHLPTDLPTQRAIIRFLLESKLCPADTETWLSNKLEALAAGK